MPAVKIWFTQVGVLFQLQKLQDEFTAAFPDETRYRRVCHRSLEQAPVRCHTPRRAAGHISFVFWFSVTVIRAATQGAGHPRQSVQNA